MVEMAQPARPTPCPRTIALGAYVLGALERRERRALEAHLDGCATCRAELDRLAPLPRLLSLAYDAPPPDGA
jgi:anti-sigma factor RsiW